MSALAYALAPSQMMRSVDASRDTLGRVRMNLIDILATAVPVPELGGIRFIRPELLLVTQLLRPGAMAAIAATELTVARRAKGGFDPAYAERWAAQVGRAEALRRTFARADELEQNP